MSKFQALSKSALQVILSLVLAIGLLPVLPQQAQAEQQAQETRVETQAQIEQQAQIETQTPEEQADLQTQIEQQTQYGEYSTQEYSAEATYSWYRVWLYGNEYDINVTVDIYKYNANEGTYEQKYKNVAPSNYPISGFPGEKYRVEFNVPANMKVESSLNIKDGIECNAVADRDYAWELVFPNTAPSEYSESSITVNTYAPATVTCEDVENGTIKYEFTEGDGYEGTVQATFTPASGYILEKAEYKRSGTSSEGSWNELTAEKQEDGTYTAQFKVNKSTTSYTYSIRATFVKTEKLDIASEKDLLDFATRVKNGESFAGSTVTLKNDITLPTRGTPLPTLPSEELLMEMVTP